MRGVIRHEGLIAGGRRVLSGWSGFFFLVVKKPAQGDVLFITGGVSGDVTHYRSLNQSEELGSHGFRCAVVSQDNLWLPKYADDFKVFIFQRVLFTSAVAKLIGRIKEGKKEIIFEADDLIFDPEYLTKMDFFHQMNDLEKKLYTNGLGVEILNDPYVRTCVTSTSFLASKLEEKSKKVFVVKNKLSDRELEIADHIIARPKKKDGSVRIGYYSGTFSHNKDFATVTDVLKIILEKHRNVNLVLAGPLDMENKLNEFSGRIEILPRVSRDEYYANVRKCDINIVPLEAGNPFCEAKSEIKFIEAGVLGIPTVAVRNQTFSETIVDGQDGFLAATEAEWIERISRLVEDEKLRQAMGENARQKIIRDYTNKNSHSEKYYTYLKSVLEK